MSAKSSIQWTDATWSPLRARVKENAAEIARAKGYTSLVQLAGKMAGHVGPHCEHVSDGCNNCYSESNNSRCLPSNGTGLPFDRRSRDLVDIFLDGNILEQPLHWRAPRKIFVNSQTDTFGEFVPDELIDRMFAVMALCPQHTFQVLTKRAARMREYFGDLAYRQEVIGIRAEYASGFDRFRSDTGSDALDARWPLPLRNVWLGVSVEDDRQNHRIEDLRQTPAAKRFASYEPALGPVDFSPWLSPCTYYCDHDEFGGGHRPSPGLDWVIVGGESGRNARRFDIAWAYRVIEQCKAADVACFVKQLGAWPTEERNGIEFVPLSLKDGHGGDMTEWPEDLRVREFPIMHPQTPARSRVTANSRSAIPSA